MKRGAQLKSALMNLKHVRPMRGGLTPHKASYFQRIWAVLSSMLECCTSLALVPRKKSPDWIPRNSFTRKLLGSFMDLTSTVFLMQLKRIDHSVFALYAARRKRYDLVTIVAIISGMMGLTLRTSIRYFIPTLGIVSRRFKFLKITATAIEDLFSLQTEQELLWK